MARPCIGVRLGVGRDHVNIAALNDPPVAVHDPKAIPVVRENDMLPPMAARWQDARSPHSARRNRAVDVASARLSETIG